MTLAWGQIKNVRYFWIDVKKLPTLIQAPAFISFFDTKDSHTRTRHPARRRGKLIIIPLPLLLVIIMSMYIFKISRFPNVKGFHVLLNVV